MKPKFALRSAFFAASVLLVAARLVAAEINVFAAASLTDVLKEIATAYEKESGDKIIFNLGASSALARQIQEGAPADVFISADEEKMNLLAKRDLIVKETRQSLLSNQLVVVTEKESDLEISSPDDLAGSNVRRIALAEPKTVPAGIYAKSWLEKKNLWNKVADKIVPTENVRAALAAVESGNVDAAVVYKTDALISKKVRVSYEVPLKDGPDISYPVALIKESKNPDAAARFLECLKSKEAGEIFRSFGFVRRE